MNTTTPVGLKRIIEREPLRFNTKRCKCGVVTSAVVVGYGVSEGGTTISAVLENREHRDTDGFSPAIACRSCGKMRWAYAVRGIFRANVKCDARCTEAKGHNCECSCGGRNHGAGHSEGEAAPAEQLAP